MRARRVLGAACVAAAVLAAFASPAYGQAATKKYDWHPENGAQDIDVQDGKVVVSNVLWDMGGTMKGTPLRKSSANVRVRIDNNGSQDAKSLCVISPAALGPEYFREAAEILKAAAGGPPDRAKMAELMRRYGLTMVAPPPQP